MLDPTKLTAKQAKAMGIWPPQDSIAVAVLPYLKRMKNKVDVLDVGVGKGENFVYLDEELPANKIGTFYGLSHDAEYETQLVENVKDISQVDRDYMGQPCDVVMVTMIPQITARDLAEYYEKVKPGGIFIGDKHNEVYCKEALGALRGIVKGVGPIQIINRTFWFWYKR